MLRRTGALNAGPPAAAALRSGAMPPSHMRQRRQQRSHERAPAASCGSCGWRGRRQRSLGQRSVVMLVAPALARAPTSHPHADGIHAAGSSASLERDKRRDEL